MNLQFYGTRCHLNVKYPIAVGIDPGSKKDSWTVQSAAHTYLNIQADAVTWVKEHVEQRRQMRRARRYRQTPCRQPRFNRARGGLPPSTKARWQWKLRLAKWLAKLFPISTFVVEDGANQKSTSVFIEFDSQ